MDPLNGIFYVIVLIFSVVVHEVAHGYAAEYFGDPTARLAGRLTMNPIKHIDPVGSVILPIILALSNAGFMVGWARPVPYNSENFDNKKKGTIVVALAGISANIFLAIIFGLLIRFSPYFGIVSLPFLTITSTIVIVNLVLALFNIIPIPPLDGSKVLFELLPIRFQKIRNILEIYQFFFLIIFIFFLWQYIAPPVVTHLYAILTGIAL